MSSLVRSCLPSLFSFPPPPLTTYFIVKSLQVGIPEFSLVHDTLNHIVSQGFMSCCKGTNPSLRDTMQTCAMQFVQQFINCRETKSHAKFPQDKTGSQNTFALPCDAL